MFTDRSVNIFIMQRSATEQEHSDHSIQVRGAYRELHEWMTEFLLEKWGKGGYRRGW